MFQDAGDGVAPRDSEGVGIGEPTVDETTKQCPTYTARPQVRQRQGGGAKGVLPQMEDKLLCMLVYQETNPLQTMTDISIGGFGNYKCPDSVTRLLECLNLELASVRGQNLPLSSKPSSVRASSVSRT